MVKYIHERPEWPKFQWDTGVLADRLAAVRHRQGRLIGRMEILGFSLRDEAVLETLTRDVLTSSEIEGEMLDPAQVRSSIARRLGMDIAGLVPADRDVEGVVEMMLDATQKFDEPLTVERLFAWHASLFPTGRSGMTRILVGAWRDDSAGPMQVVSGPFGREQVHYQAPDAARLDRETKLFLEWFNAEQKIDPVLKSGIAHLWFVSIHPFDDGNGRIARAIADMALARSEGSSKRFYSLSAQIRQERGIYYKDLERVQKGDLDITEWLRWYLDCLDRAIEGAEVILANVLKKARFWECHAEVTFNDRQKDILMHLLAGLKGKLTTSKYAKIESCSQDTALRDIKELLRLSILQKDTGGGRSTSYSLVEP
ncbi:Fic family protein [Desulfatiglans anilini]|uniref:Fic family protein n=1 Tax=Desulfatiglans anilini TaxID=90728 RepID=UPI0003F7376F|nr:Fic family protein [Desulfatiglans anilini]